MRQLRLVPPVMFAILAFLALPGGALAQDSGFTLALMGGVGGSPDSDGYSDGNLQLLGTMKLGLKTYTELRLGRLDLSASPDLPDSELTYLALGTDYRLDADFYSSGLVLGIGYYQLEGDSGFLDEDGLGLHVGVLGEFSLSDHWTFLAELTGHYADLDAAQIFLIANVGIGYRF
ncbi:MAG: porin family protein [Holophagales bacterium]|nr:porin family protein [Holophagales bacterium]